ncbi:unnamed protein product [Somion occarium]|uniref:Nuclear condensin complex subunit 3 C-terminal domain-containing protein n=2 Tax=Somion occarium TaxID=3059160 RepID=A0ABP1CT26_9APHY
MVPKTSVILDALPDHISNVFDQSQLSVVNHRKNCVALHKLHARAASVTQPTKDGGVQLIGERLFSNAFIDMVTRVLVIKKGSVPADRVVKFIGAYVRFLTEKALQPNTKGRSGAAVSQQSDVDDEDTPHSRFVALLLSYLLKGFEAKDKTVRFRVVNIVTELVSHLGELDEDVYEMLRSSLMARARDKESLVRAHAVTALSKLLSGEDPDDLEEGEPSILDTMLDSMCYDPSGEVRRFALLNTPLTPVTLPSILTRTRDVDNSVRTYLYAVILLPPSPSTPPSASATRQPSHSPTRLNHPRQLTIAQRERVVKDGLGDREDKVRAAAGKMLGAWFDQVADEVKMTDGEDKQVTSLVAFLKLFDVASVEGGSLASDALNSVFMTRPQVLNAIVFQDTFWKELTPESILLARVYIEHVSSRDDATRRLEVASLPVVTAFAFYTQEACNAIFDTMEQLEEARSAAIDVDEDAEIDELDAQLIDRVFVLGEVLKIAAKLDYTDEIGRRKMFQVIRDILAHELFPESLMDPCLDILKTTTPSEKEIIRIIVEIITELRDSVFEGGVESLAVTEEGLNTTQSGVYSRSSRRDRTMAEMTPEERIRSDETDIRCLSLCIATLKRVNGSFEENSTLEGILTDLIIPAVKRKELALRERGLVSLGLCCLIAKNMAMSSFQLFLSQVQSSSEDLKLKVLQVVFDILMIYEEDLLRRSKDIAERIIAFLLQTLEVEESQAVQALLCIGISKLMLNGLVTDERVLTSLVLAYVSPVTADNQELRQCLSYFLPVYSYSSFINQDRMRSVFLTAYDLVAAVYEDLDGDQDMITPSQFGTLFVDWTNPKKNAASESSGVESKDTHVEFAIDLLMALYAKDRAGDDKRVFCQILGKLYFPDHPQPDHLACIDTLLQHIDDHLPADDIPTQKLLDRFAARFRKQFWRQVERMDRSPLKRSQDYRDVCELVGLDMSEEEAEGEHEADGSDVDLETVSAPDRDADSGVDQDDERQGSEPPSSRSVSRSPAPPPSPSRNKPANRRVSKKNHSPASDSPSISGSYDENSLIGSSPSPVVVTPKRRQIAKRFRTPGTPSTLSPAHKRTDNRKTPQRRAKPLGGDPFVDTTNQRRAKRRTRHQAAYESEENQSDSSDDDSGEESPVRVSVARRLSARCQSPMSSEP